MRVFVYILLVLLLVPVVGCVQAIIQYYNSINKDVLAPVTAMQLMSQGMAELFAGYLFFYVISVILAIKRKYTASVVLSVIMLVVYIVQFF